MLLIISSKLLVTTTEQQSPPSVEAETKHEASLSHYVESNYSTSIYIKPNLLPCF